MPLIETLVVLEDSEPFSTMVFDNGARSFELGPEWGPIGSSDGFGRTGGFPNPTKFDIAKEGLLMLAVEVLRRRNIHEEDSVGGLETDPDAFGNRLIEVKDFLVAEENIAWRHLGRDVSEIFLGNSVVLSRQPLSDEGAVFLASELAGHVSLTFLDIFQDGKVDEEVRDYFGNWGFDFKWIPRSD